MNRPIDIHIGKALKLLRERRSLSYSDLEIAANISAGSIIKFETGAITIKANELFQISKALQVKIGYFYKDNFLRSKSSALLKNDQSKLDVNNHATEQAI